MKKKSTSKSAFFNLRVLIASVLCLVGVSVALMGSGVFASTKNVKNNRSTSRQDAPGTQNPEVVPMVGPVLMRQDLRKLPFVPSTVEVEHQPLMRHPRARTGGEAPEYQSFQKLLDNVFRPMPTMPPPLLTFDGVNFSQSGCGCYPPDTNGDVGPNHYVQSVNSSFRVFDKTGAPLTGAITFNSFFSSLAGTPCQNLNRGDPFVFYDHAADRWVITDFAFASFPGTNFYECVGVSQSPDPVVGPWALYAILVDAANLDDYPKGTWWTEPAPGGSYVFTFNLFPTPTSFAGVKVVGLDRGSMLNNMPANAIIQMIPPAGLGDSYSLVPAGYRTGNPPPAGRDQMLLAVDSPANENTSLNVVKGWLLHLDFVTPANSTLGLGANHSPNAMINVTPFVEAWTNAAGFQIVPQSGTAVKLDTLGDKIMTPVVYQFRNGVESLWADQTVLENFPNGPSAVRWYQFDVTGGTFPASAAQQQTFDNGADGIWRYMPSLAVDSAGNTAIGYSVSSASTFPGIRYAGRLQADPPNTLGQGEAVMTDGAGSQTGSAGRWGDYSMTTMDTDGVTFWHTNEYYTGTASVNWFTRVGKFNFGGGASPTPTPTATPASCSWAAGPSLPSVGTRFVGVYFPANGKFYAMGGRASDVAGSDFMHPFEYNPVGNSWTTKAATYPDNQVNNMGCAVLNDGGTDYIYCVGGSAAGASTATDRVFRYDPVADAITTVTAWPGAMGTILPGGFSVFNNKMYIFGGFNINIGMVTDIWEYTPGGAGAWAHKSAMLPTALGYIPAATVGNHIYMAGGSTWDGTTIHDSNVSTAYDPVADSIANIATIPRATAETRGLNFCNTMYVMGGGRDAPNPSNEVDIYDPASNSWSMGTPFVNARRNFATDTDGTNNIWLVGGYDISGAPTDSMEIFNCPVSPCASPSPTPTATATATATATPTPTATVPGRETPTPRPRPTPAPRP